MAIYPLTISSNTMIYLETFLSSSLWQTADLCAWVNLGGGCLLEKCGYTVNYASVTSTEHSLIQEIAKKV